MKSTCLGCGCACDDIELRIDANRIVAADRACPLGQAWFGSGEVPDRRLVAGRDASMEAAIDAAAVVLSAAARPLIYLAADTSCEAQREAIAIADRLRARVASLTWSGALGSVLAMQEQGRASATLGEIRNRADVLVFWGVDPAVRYPRYWTRYAPEPIGMHIPEGRRSRTVIAVDVGEARGPADADLRWIVPRQREVAVLTMLAAAVATGPFATSDQEDDERAQVLAALHAGRYVVVVADAERDDSIPPADPDRAGALIALAQVLNATTRGALSTLRGGGNRSGADACMTWQTGYPTAVDFARGYPRYRPYDLHADTADSTDGVLVCGSADAMPSDALRGVRDDQLVVVGPRASTGPLAGARVVIDTGVAGIHERGTAVRMDDIALPLRPALRGPVSAAAAIRQVGDRVSLRVEAKRLSGGK